MELALRSYEFWLWRYRRVWRGSFATSLVNPVLYLAALGIGLGSLVNHSATRPGHVSYLDFVAPGMLAAAAMQTAASESSFPVLAAMKWVRQYHAQLATPLGIRDVLFGHQLFVVTRVAMSSGIYLAVIAAFGAIRSGYGVLAWPAAVLTGAAFAAPIAAYAAGVAYRSGAEFNPLFRFGIVPMFLFSGTFFPVSRLPVPLDWVAYVTPLWHGVALARDLTLGRVGALADCGHAVYLLAWCAGGLVLALRMYRRRLES
jgi:lipooligosaccharide transport system permease protein